MLGNIFRYVAAHNLANCGQLLQSAEKVRKRLNFDI